MTTTDKGMYPKFKTPRRVDGRDTPGQKHDHCDYFILDITHDPYALPALTAYAQACQKTYPALAADLDGAVQLASLR